MALPYTGAEEGPLCLSVSSLGLTLIAAPVPWERSW